jgi:hypothetical protein
MRRFKVRWGWAAAVAAAPAVAAPAVAAPAVAAPAVAAPAVAADATAGAAVVDAADAVDACVFPCTTMLSGLRGPLAMAGSSFAPNQSVVDGDRRRSGASTRRAT